MPGIIVVGSQWGDEGKGKVIDVFSAQADFVVRYQGGANHLSREIFRLACGLGQV